MFIMLVYVGQNCYQHDNKRKEVIPCNHNHHPFQKVSDQMKAHSQISDERYETFCFLFDKRKEQGAGRRLLPVLCLIVS